MRSMTLPLILALVASGCEGQASPSPSPSASPSVSAAQATMLLEPGDSVTIDAVDADGTWGTVTARRSEETGGYPSDAIDPGTFIVEVLFTYRADRQPVGEFGRPDWALATADDRRPVGRLFDVAQPPNPDDFDPERQQLGTFPGATDVTGEPIAAMGMLYFQVPRELEAQRLALVYRPEGFTEAVTAFVVRDAGPAPDPVPTATPPPAPEALSYVEQPGLPFTVIEDERADDLFDDPDTCTNPEDGYTVTFPDAWYTNTATGDTPACSWFSPVFYEVQPTEEVPDEVVVTIRVFDGALGFINQPDYSLNEEVEIGGFAGWRQEQIGTSYPAGGYEAQPPTYSYVAVLSDGPGEGPTMTAATGSEGVEDYELNKAVLDRIMASLTFED